MGKVFEFSNVSSLTSKIQLLNQLHPPLPHPCLLEIPGIVPQNDSSITGREVSETPAGLNQPNQQRTKLCKIWTRFYDLDFSRFHITDHCFS